MAITKVIDVTVNGKDAENSLNNLNKSVKNLDQSATDLNATFEDVYGDLKPLTARMGEAEDRLYELALAGKSTTKEYKDLLGAVANYRQVQIKTDAIVDASATTLDVKLGGALQGASSAFAGVQGAMALMGSESEELQEALLKVQAAMALSEGIRGVREGITSFKALKTSAMTALSGIRAGIAATGIGLLVVALGSIVAYWDDIKGAVSGVTDEQKKLNEATAKNVTAQQEKLDSISGQENILKLQGKSERDILKMKVAQTDQIIKATEAQIKQNDITAKAQIAASQRNKDILKGILDFISKPLQIVLSAIDGIGEAFGKDFGLSEGLSRLVEGSASLLFDPEAERLAAEATRQESLKALEKLKNDRAGFVLAIRNIDNQARAGLTQREEVTAVGGNLQGVKPLSDEERLQKELELAQAKVNAELFANQERERLRLEDLENERLIQQQKLALTANFLGAVASVLGEQSKAGKAFAVAQALINTYQGISNVWAEKSEAGFVGAGLLQRIATTAIVAAQGFNTVKNIMKVNPMGASVATPSGATGAGGSATAPPTFNVVGGNVANQIGQVLGNQPPVQAFVVGSQVTSQQAMDRNIVNNASLG